MCERTKEQSKSAEWKAERRCRLTASRFGEVCKSTERKDKVKLAESLISDNQFSNKAIRHGLQYEQAATEKFSNMLNLEVTKTGLHVSPQFPFLGATPDGLVGNDAILEIKCPYTIKDKVISQSTVPFLDSSGLKKTHNYYFQVQGQLWCTNRLKCYFCVYTLADFRVFVIERDCTFIQDMLIKLIDFYYDYFKPTLLDKMVYRNYGKYF